MADHGSVSSHGMAGDGHFGGIHREEAGHYLGQLFGDVVVHSVVLGPLGSHGVAVETGAGTKVPAIIGSLDGHTPWIDK